MCRQYARENNFKKFVRVDLFSFFATFSEDIIHRIMRQYELLLLLDPTLGEGDQATLLSEVRDEIATTGARITSEDVW